MWMILWVYRQNRQNCQRHIPDENPEDSFFILHSSSFLCHIILTDSQFWCIQEAGL
jgi:hypothetical protein